MAKPKIKAKRTTTNKKRKSNIEKQTNFQNRHETKGKLNSGVFTYTEPLTIATLSNYLNISVPEILKFLLMEGVMATINTPVDEEIAALVCLNFGYDFEKDEVVDECNFEEIIIEDKPEDLVERPPVVTIMGHVDHGKTTLLDTIRKSNVVEGEFGGITQGIGAYQVEVQGKKITFIDTPGHEAFTAMRARGSQVTDLVIIIVAADDGVMPQTKEAIDHAKAAGVPIIVAINKIDKPGVDPEKIKYTLSDLDLMPEEWGGETIYRNISAKTREGIDELLETILIVAELNEFCANPNRYGVGTVIEAELDKSRGTVVSLLIQNGSLNHGDSIVVGASFGKIRQMTDDKGRILKTAGPSTPVSVLGLSEVPNAGDKFMAFSDERHAKSIATRRMERKIEQERRCSSAMSLEDLYAQTKTNEVAILNIIVKADVQGSAEAVKSSLEKLDMKDVKINVIRHQAGQITESDILLASASNAIVYGFNIRPNANVRKIAEEQGIEIRFHRIIYKLIEEIEAAMKGMLKPEFEEKITGQIEVRQLFKVSKIGTIAGSYVTDGIVKANSKIRLIRDGVIIYEGELSSLKRFQNDVKEVRTGFECGLTIENFNDIKEGDIVEAYEMVEIKQK